MDNKDNQELLKDIEAVSILKIEIDKITIIKSILDPDNFFEAKDIAFYDKRLEEIVLQLDFYAHRQSKRVEILLENGKPKPKLRLIHGGKK